ncbi:MAG: choice-of-anchor L domain-containing protein [Bacteroidota bacterium]
MRFLSLLLFSAIGGLLHAQFTPSDLVITDIRNYLYDSTLSNVTTFGDTFFQSQSQIGTFQNQQGLLGIDSGLVFSSGKIDDINQAVGNGSILNRPGDTLLNTLIGVNSNDVSGVQFTFLALTDTLRIPFVFATKEYPSFFGSFNDGAGIFIKGPGYPSFTNIAKLTLSNLPVTALNIGNPSTLDSFLTLSSLPPPNLGGYTEKMETAAPVAIGQPYEVRIVVGDGGDYAFNSYLFVGRIKPPIYYPALRVNGQSVMGGGSILLDEGDSANLVFARTQTTDTDTISLALAGNASLGSDYLMAVDTLFMLPGQDSVSLTLLTFNECLNEGSEEIQLSWQATSQSAPGLPLMDSLSFVIEDFLVPDSLLQASAAVLCSGDTLPLGIPSVAGYSYQWSPFLGLSSQSGPQNLFSLDNPSNAVILQEYVVTATHPNGCSTTDSIQITVRPGLPPFSPLNQATCSQELIELGQPYDSTLGYQFQWLPDSHLSQAQTPNPIFQLVTTTPATYQYEMQVVDPWGCQTSTNESTS